MASSYSRIEHDGCVSSKGSKRDYKYEQNKPQVDIHGPMIDAVEYPMDHRYRGRAIIFNHDKDRVGTMFDVEELEKTFRSLDFVVHTFNNLTKNAVISHLFQVSQDDLNENADCLVIIVLTHGEDGYVNAEDGKYETKELWTPFYADVCPSLAAKPKLFFIQACRGTDTDNGVKIQPRRRLETDSAPSRVTYTIPKCSDMLIAYATPPGFYAWRSPNEGSWFIQSLCRELMQNGSTTDILTILTNVNRRVSIQYQSSNRKPEFNAKKQTPAFYSTLMRQLIFRPKLTAQSGVRETAI